MIGASNDPRVIESRKRLLAIPWWRMIKRWRETDRHIRLVNQVIAERRQQRRG